VLNLSEGAKTCLPKRNFACHIIHDSDSDLRSGFDASCASCRPRYNQICPSAATYRLLSLQVQVGCQCLGENGMSGENLDNRRGRAVQGVQARPDSEWQILQGNDRHKCRDLNKTCTQDKTRQDMESLIPRPSSTSIYLLVRSFCAWLPSFRPDATMPYF
jgi:hypothetical protein